jgi:hypothetical protein
MARTAWAFEWVSLLCRYSHLSSTIQPSHTDFDSRYKRSISPASNLENEVAGFDELILDAEAVISNPRPSILLVSAVDHPFFVIGSTPLKSIPGRASVSIAYRASLVEP